MTAWIAQIQQLHSVYGHVYTHILRWVAPALAFIILFRSIIPLLTFRREPEIWAWLCLTDGKKLPITHWESVVGRSRRSDIVIGLPSVARNHCVLTRYDDGSWSITATDSSDGVLVNGKRVSIYPLTPKDVISIGGVEMTLQPISRRQELKLAQLRTRGGSFGNALVNVLLLSVFQVLCALAFVFQGSGELMSILYGFAGIGAMQWLLLIFYTCIRKTAFEVETVAFFLTTLGMAAIATVCPDEAVKQLIAVGLGLVVFLVLGWSLRDLERAKKIRYLAGLAGVGFLVITLLFGQEYYGAKNWLVIGSLSLQPSELSKVCFAFVGASTMDRLMKKRNLILFISYTIVLCGCLALMNDFGTALIFFVAFLVIAYMRSGSVGTLALAITALGFAGVVALRIAPHALRRFDAWRHIWESPWDAGYQQTRALMCMASGGFLGLGAGEGWMKHVFAADSDVVIATISEEWGLFIVILCICGIVGLAFFTVRAATVGRSSFYTIGGCTAASILVAQVILNALGTVDVVPLTGVTFPFLSNGGSSMIGAWGLLAFVKAVDTRQSASFAVRISKEGVEEDE